MSTRSPASLAPLIVEPKPSRLLRLILLLAAGMALVALSLTDLARLVVGALGCVTLAYLLILASIHTGWPRPLPWPALRWDGRRWMLRHRSGRWLPVELCESVIWPGVTALRFQGPGRRSIRLILASDALSVEARRRLHLHLRTLSVHGPGR